MLIAIGVVCLNSAFSFTALNLPVDESTIDRNEAALSVMHAKQATEVIVSDNTSLKPELIRDTILMDAADINRCGPFPSTSRDCILSQVPYPDFARKQQLEGGVTVRFLFDEYGHVQVLESCSNSPELEQYVVQRMAQLELKNCVVDVNKDYYMRFMFRLF
jgi:outer membrane biosynthesis protein TonB